MITDKDVPVQQTSMPDDLKRIAENYIKVARKILEEEGNIKPMAFIGLGDDVAVFPWGNSPNTTFAANAIRHVCKKGKATWVIVLMESWLRRLDIEKPKRLEAVSFIVETRERSWTGTALQEERGGKKTFGEMKFNEAQSSAGTFVGLIPNEGTQH